MKEILNSSLLYPDGLVRWSAQYQVWNQKWNNPGRAALEVLVCAEYRLAPVPVRAWRFSLRWWVWGLCCHPLQSSCSRSTACPLARQTQSTSHQASHLSSATQRGSVSASHTHTKKKKHAQNECEFPNTPWISLSLYFSFSLSLLLSVSLISLLWFHRHQRDLQAIVVKPLIDHLSFPVPLSAHVCLIYWTQNNKTQTRHTAHLSYTHTYKRALSGSSRPAGCLGKRITPDLSHTATGSVTSPLGHLPSLNREEGTQATDTSCTEPLQTVSLHSKWYQISIHTHTYQTTA